MIRVHVHDALVDAWLTPSSLTVRPRQFPVTSAKFSLLASFADETIGDIGNWPEVRWSTDPPSAVSPDVSDIQIIETGDWRAG